MKYIRTHKSLLLLIIPAFFLQMLIMMPSGTHMCIGNACGYHFWGVNSFDGMSHLQIAATSFRTYPFIVPTYAGETLAGYNFLMDLGLYLLSLIGIPPIVTLFKIIPPLWFIFYTYLTISLARRIKDSPVFVAILLFFIYFASHFGYILQIYHEGSIMAGSQSFGLQSLTELLNTQFAISLLGILAMLILIQKKVFDLKTAVILGTITALNFGLKFYGGTVSLILVGAYLAEGFARKKQFFSSLKQAIVIGIFVLGSIVIFYNPAEASKTGAPFTFAPFSIVHSMIEEQNMVYMRDMVNARYFLFENAPYSPRLLAIELFSSLIYIVLNFGTRIFGILYAMYLIIRRKNNRLDAYVLLAVIGSIMLSIALIQKGDWWNTVQFSYYGIFLSNILIARLIYSLYTQKNIFSKTALILLIILTIPSNAQVLAGFTSTKTAYIPEKEIKGLAHLNKAPSGVVFAAFDFIPEKGYPFMSYENTGYVSAFTNKQLYFGHIGPLTILGIEYKKRYERIKAKDCTVLDEVDYIYYVKDHKNDWFVSCKSMIDTKFTQSYEDEGVLILKKGSR